MKGVMLGINPEIRFLDVSHGITPFDVMDAAFVLRQAIPYYPEGTIHLVVVDPGVGTARRGVALGYDGRFFVGPDNGVFALLLGDADPDEIVVLDREASYRTPSPCNTFHGRDIFAPAAARLASGSSLQDIGTPVDALQRLHWALPIDDSQGIRGWIVHIDHFGNCITNIPRTLFYDRQKGRIAKCYVGNSILNGVHATYGAVDVGEPLLLFGSEEFLEISVNTGNAADLLHIRRGTPVNIVFLDDR